MTLKPKPARAGLLICLPVLGVLATTTSARAGLEEVIVTTQKIEQNVLDVPHTVEVIDSETIQDLGINSIESFYQSVPGLIVAPIAGDNTGSRLFVRGIGSPDALIGQDPAVSVYRDGIYQPRGQALNLNYADIERVEVLKGPHGTLYGRNTLGGAINIVSRRASTERTHGRVYLGTNNYAQRSAQALINIPFSSQFAAKLAVFSDAENGWVENQTAGLDFSARNRKGFRLDLVYDNHDSFRLDYSLDRSSAQDSGYYYQPMPLPAAIDAGPLPVRDLVHESFSAERLDRVDGSNRNNNADSLINSIQISWDYADSHSFKFLSGYSSSSSRSYVNFDNAFDNQKLSGFLSGLVGSELKDSEVVILFSPGASAPENSGINDAVSLYNYAVGQYNALAGQYSTMAGGAEAGLQAYQSIEPVPSYNPDTDGQAVYGLSPDRGRPFDNNSLSLEFQFNGASASDQVHYVSGLYFFTESNRYAQYAGYNDILEWLGGIDLAWGQQLGEILGDGASQQRLTDLFVDTIAALGAGNAAQARGHLGEIGAFLDPLQRPDNNLIIEGSSLSAEYGSKATSVAGYANVNYIPSESWDFTFGLRATFDDRTVDTVRFDPLGGDRSAEHSHDLSASFNRVNFLLVSRYHPTERSSIYLSANTSYRAGGFNETYTSTNPDDLLFNEEEIRGYEFGYKAAFGDSWRLATAVFYYQLPGLQYTIFNPLNPVQRSTVNTDGTVAGLDLALLVALTNYWELSLSYVNLERSTGSYHNPFSGQIDYPVSIQSPHNSANLSLNGTVPFATLYEMNIHVGLDYTSKTHIVEGISQDAYLLARLDLNFVLDAFTLTLWSRNIADTSYIIDGLPFATVSGTGPDLVIFGQPRTVGLGATYTF